MKICATVAEYNPLHLGHVKHIDYIKNVLGAEKLIVVMSGNFTQRGEPAVLNKYQRAKQAIIAGADMVIELPTVFATANAEVFAKGAVKIINDLGVVDGLCFGVESGDKDAYVNLATAMNNETKEFKKALKEQLESGVSLAKAKFNAVKSLGGVFDESLISSPNNVLGLEYVKALQWLKSDINVFPMHREGDHNDKKLKRGITSATSIREILKTGKLLKVKGNVPPYVFKELVPYPTAFDKMIMTAIVKASSKDLEKISDCTEGLENRIKALAKDSRSVDVLVDKVTTKRYTSSRIRRILISNLVGIEDKLVKDSLTTPLYAKVLAVSSDSKELISLISNNGNIPLLTRKSDASKLKRTAKKCFEVDVLANDLYNLATNQDFNENYMIIV